MIPLQFVIWWSVTSLGSFKMKLSRNWIIEHSTNSLDKSLSFMGICRLKTHIQRLSSKKLTVMCVLSVGVSHPPNPPDSPPTNSHPFHHPTLNLPDTRFTAFKNTDITVCSRNVYFYPPTNNARSNYIATNSLTASWVCVCVYVGIFLRKWRSKLLCKATDVKNRTKMTRKTNGTEWERRETVPIPSLNHALSNAEVLRRRDYRVLKIRYIRN